MHSWAWAVMSCSSMQSEAGLMSGLGARENFSLSRLKAPAKGVLKVGTAGLPHTQPWLRRHPCTPTGPAGLACHTRAIPPASLPPALAP